jgi:hypothetical protein
MKADTREKRPNPWFAHPSGMKHTYLALLLLSLGAQAIGADTVRLDRSVPDPGSDRDSLRIVFDENGGNGFSPEERIVVEGIVRQSESEVRTLLPSLPAEIVVTVVIIDRDVDIVGGVTGRASAPGEVQIELSSIYPGGILAAAESALSSSVFHELHHLYRGWTIQENRFGPGIVIAAVNEGLADVFTETYTGIYFEEASGYPENVE